MSFAPNIVIVDIYLIIVYQGLVEVHSDSLPVEGNMKTFKYYDCYILPNLVM